jgi:predicted Fe-S protein YdhL (DUF1289 family)
MKSSKTTLVLYFLCAIGVGAVVARFLSSPPTTVDRTAAVPGAPKSVGGGGDPKPGSVVRSAKALKLDKSTNVIPDLDKESRLRDLTAKEALESKFRNWRDDGRKQFEEIFQGDRERTGLVMRALFQKEEFRGMFQQSRELEAKWPKATDDEKAAIMAQMESIRTQGLAMVRAEAARQASGANGQGNVQVQTLGGATLVTPNQPVPTPTAPAAAPAPAPVIIM